MGENEKKSKAPKDGEKKNVFQKIAGFFRGVSAEFGKIIWPSRETLTKEMGVALAVSVVLCLIIAILDAIMRFGVGILVK